MAKNIVFCADGTWNDPNQDENHDNLPDQTNVYKLFMALQGELDSGSIRSADEQEKALGTRQVAKYIHGVGDSKNPINKLFGGAFGAGIITRVVRGYTFISRNYQPGDAIYIVGFSRGAYTARALGGLICSQGLLAQKLTTDREQAYRHGAEAWYRYRKALNLKTNIFSRLAEIVRDLPAFLSCDSLKDADFVPVDSLAAVGVWDTVGAMGIPKYSGNANYDAFQFADTKLSTKVKMGFHAVSRDEQRQVFSPTLWDKAANVTQLLFAGAHADVGGGYPQVNRESGLSDIALCWMLDNLKGAGMLLNDCPAKPDPAGTAHKPWMHAPWDTLAFPHCPRTFKPKIAEHPSVQQRRDASPVKADQGEKPSTYE